MDDVAQARASASLDIASGGEFTVELWIKPSSVGRAQPLLEWSDSQAVVGMHFWISVSSLSSGGGPGSLFANLTDTAGTAHHVSTSSDLLVVNVFQHVALTYSRVAGIARMYLNGVKVAEANLGTFTPETRPDVLLGCRRAGGAFVGFSGAMDEVSFYSRALAVEEIAAIFQAGSAGKCPTNTPSVPVITAQPQNKAAFAGQTATFTVSARGTAPLAYQWLFQDNPIVDATGVVLVLTNVQATQAGEYAVIVTNVAGAVTSSSAMLAVNPTPPCLGALNGLTVWWPLDGDANEVISGESIALSAGTAFVPSLVGPGLAFDGVQGGGRAAASPALDIGAGAGLTIELWVRPSNVSQQQALVEWSDTRATVGLHFWTSVSSSHSGGGPGSLFANLTDTAGLAHHVSSLPGLLAADRFQHVALTYDSGIGVARIYLDGVMVAEKSVGSFAIETRPDVYFGRGPLRGLSSSFSGVMDEISFYSRA